MADPITAAIVTILGKYVIDKGVELAKDVGPAAVAKAADLAKAAFARLRKEPKGQVVADGFEEDLASELGEDGLDIAREYVDFDPAEADEVTSPIRPIVLATLLLAVIPARSFAGPGDSFKLEPTRHGVDLLPGFSAAALQDSSEPENVVAEPENVVAPSGADPWRVGFMPAFWVPVSFDGTINVGPVATEIDLDFDDLMDALDFVIEGGLTVTNDDWSILAYGSYFKLGADVTSQTLLGMEEKTSMDYELTLIDVAVGKRIVRGPLGAGSWRADLLGGLRYWDQKVEIDQTDPDPDDWKPEAMSVLRTPHTFR